MNKTYHARVFGGREAVWKGIDQGKHPLYPNTVNMAMNATFSEDVFRARSGQVKVNFTEI